MNRLLYTVVAALCVSPTTYVNAETLDKQQAFIKALHNNPSYRAALADIRSAEGQRAQASLLVNPNAVFEIENFAGEDEQEGFDGAELTFGIEQTIEIGGKRKNRTSIADYDVKISHEQAKAQALSLLAETEYAFIRLAVAEEGLKLADRRLGLADKTHDIVKNRIGAAKAPEIQHTKADIEKASAEVEKRQAQKELLSAKNNLARILGGSEDAEGISVDVSLDKLPQLMDRQVMIDALQQSPQARMQQFMNMRAKSSLSLAHSYSLPDPTFGIGVRRFNENDSTALIASISIPIPVFNRNQGEIVKAQADVVKAEAIGQASYLTQEQSAIDAWESLSSAIEETKRYQSEIIPSARKAYNQADEGYSRGAFSFLDLLDAQRTLNEVQEAHLKSILNLYQAKVQAEFLMGTHETLVQNINSSNEGETK
ncbi:MAG: TolC family protein [Alphaproteobacteria bacterium]